MTIIVTFINHHGVIHGADSNISGALRSGDRIAPKIFRIPILEAAVSVAGSYSVGGEPMDLWMPTIIREYEATGRGSLEGFANWLGGNLQHRMTSREKLEDGCLMHLAGFVTDARGRHPEFHFIRNLAGVDGATGDYLGYGSDFTVTEDFWSRDFRAEELRAALFAGHRNMLYINGYPSGRIAYLVLRRSIDDFMKTMWTAENLGFRSPRSVDEGAALVETYLSVVVGMFRMSGQTVVGGRIQTEAIAW